MSCISQKRKIWTVIVFESDNGAACTNCQPLRRGHNAKRDAQTFVKVDNADGVRSFRRKHGRRRMYDCVRVNDASRR